MHHAETGIFQVQHGMYRTGTMHRHFLPERDMATRPATYRNVSSREFRLEVIVVNPTSLHNHKSHWGSSEYNQSPGTILG